MDTTTRTISKSERKAARKLYKKINQMICESRVRYEDIKEYTPPKPTGAELIANAIQYQGQRKIHIDYFDGYIIAIRNTAFDLPESVRKQCIDLAYKIRGREEKDPEKWVYEENHKGRLCPFSPLCDTEDYERYLKENNFPNDYDTWVMYSALFIERSYEELDEIFKDYIVK